MPPNISAQVLLAFKIRRLFVIFLKTPGDLLNVRMQNDIKVPPEQRRNYKHACDGLIRVVREEGFARLFGGCSMASTRGALMSVGQIATYDTFCYRVYQLKVFL